MKRLIFIVGFVAWFLVGCYDDKGNYDYKDINTIDGLTFMPTPITVEEGIRIDTSTASRHRKN